MHKFNVGELVVAPNPGPTGFGSSILKINRLSCLGNGMPWYHLSPVALPNYGIGYNESDLRKANVFDHIREQFNKFFKRGYYSAKWQRY